METLLAVIALYITIGMLVTCWIDYMYSKANRNKWFEEEYRLTPKGVIIIIAFFPIIIYMIYKIYKDE